MQFLEWKVFYFDSNFIEVFPKGPIDSKSALVQVMGWCQTGNKTLAELMSTQFTNAYVFNTKGRLVNSLRPIDVYMHQ